MGFDVYGLQPNNKIKPDEPDWTKNDKEAIKAYFTWQKNTPGAYFRANVWTWHPMWDFIHNSCIDIFEDNWDLLKNKEINTIKDMYESCHRNDGFIIPDEVAKKIAQKIVAFDNAGIIEQEEVKDDIRREHMEMICCDICNGTGTRKGWEGWESEKEWLMTHGTLESSDDNVPIKVSFKYAHKVKGCNSCYGIGKVKPFTSNYRFKAEYLREFAEFCNKSGGFQIW